MSPYVRMFVGLASSLPFFIPPSAARAEEVVIDGQTYRVIVASPVQGAPVPEPPPPPPRPKMLEEALADLTEQNRRLAESIERLGGKIEEQGKAKTETVYGLGAGVLMTTGQVQLVLDANLKYFFAGYYPGKGECFGLVSTIDAGHIQYHPLGFGIFRYDDRHDPLTAEFLPRGWDLMFTTGLDVRLTAGLRFRFQVSWYFPNPFDVERYAQDRIEEDLKEWERRHNGNYAAAKEQAGQLDEAAPGDFVEAEKENTRELGRAIDKHTSEAWGSYKKAGQKPWFQLGLRYEF